MLASPTMRSLRTESQSREREDSTFRPAFRGLALSMNSDVGLDAVCPWKVAEATVFAGGLSSSPPGLPRTSGGNEAKATAQEPACTGMTVR
jgi:hypothetical protein